MSDHCLNYYPLNTFFKTITTLLYLAGLVVLSDWQQRVCKGKCLSIPAPFTAGVSQGSVISIALFLIFIDDVLELELYCKFGDDVAIYYSHPKK